ncbi:MAG: hypothetical protein ACYCPQ_08125 [Elusimicrobiota bacterium]
MTNKRISAILGALALSVASAQAQVNQNSPKSQGGGAENFLGQAAQCPSGLSLADGSGCVESKLPPVLANSNSGNPQKDAIAEALASANQQTPLGGGLNSSLNVPQPPSPDVHSEAGVAAPRPNPNAANAKPAMLNGMLWGGWLGYLGMAFFSGGLGLLAAGAGYASGHWIFNYENPPKS